VKEVKSFLGLSGYYRRFIRNYGQIAKPLTSLLKKDVTFRWSDLCQQSFEQLKDLLTQSPILQYPDFSKTFNLTCDASDYAIGCVLSQGPIGKDLPIAFASRTLNKAEVNYNTTEKELTSIVWGIKMYRPYLFGQKFNIVTDHRALVWLFNITDPGSRLTRWRLKLEEYQYTIHFKPGVNNTNADALSRIHKVTTRKQSAAISETYPDTPGQNISETQVDQGPLSQHNLCTNSDDSHAADEYQKFFQAKSEHIAPTPNLKEITGDIFDTQSDIPLALFVSEDLKMNRGIALEFRRKFGNLKELQKKNRKVTDILISQAEHRKLLYIIIKKLFYHKPAYETIFHSLQNLKTCCIKNGITRLACPRLSYNLDGCKWEVIRDMLRFLFHGSSVHILVYTRDELTEEDKQRVIQEHHENPLGGHQGISRTYNKISQLYQWKGMRAQIKEYIKKCSVCQVNKTPNQTIREPMVITTTATRPFEKIYMDIVGPLPKSYTGNAYILTLIDDFSKFAWASAMKDHEANTVSQHFVTQFICLHGQPQSLVTDCGTEFLSKVFKEVCKLLKITQTSTTPYHPQSNGSLERSHRTLGEYLRNYASKNPQNWDVYVPYAMYCHNSSIHSATGFQPHEVVFGYPLVVPTSFSRNTEPQYNYQDYQYEMKRLMQETHQMVREQQIKSKEKSKDRYDQRVHSIELKVGDKVIVQEKASKGKLAPKWLGPFPVVEVKADSPNVTILKKNKQMQLHRNLLRLFHE
jgi:transposase InsO family protein